ncbi:unnamed protein product [Citrullus colocynthis]|uniref:Uncharacterized protein n=1 Tax=Citrullus colocynthis TaxID=252529 RepID=A0ABP0Y3D7_9ROSI
MDQNNAYILELLCQPNLIINIQSENLQAYEYGIGWNKIHIERLVIFHLSFDIESKERVQWLKKRENLKNSWAVIDLFEWFRSFANKNSEGCFHVVMCQVVVLVKLGFATRYLPCDASWSVSSGKCEIGWVFCDGSRQIHYVGFR